MIEQLRIVTQNSDELGGIDFHFFGYETDRLRCDEPPPNVHIHGYVNDEILKAFGGGQRYLVSSAAHYWSFNTYN